MRPGLVCPRSGRISRALAVLSRPSRNFLLALPIQDWVRQKPPNHPGLLSIVPDRTKDRFTCSNVPGLGSAEDAEPSWAKFFAIPPGFQTSYDTKSYRTRMR